MLDHPVTLGAEPLRIVPPEPLQVVGMTSDLCVTLANKTPKDADWDEHYESLTGGARVRATLLAADGSSYEWMCNGLQVHGSLDDPGRFSACMRWECHGFPPTGTVIEAVELRSSRPLKILGADWSSTASFDHVMQPPPDSSATSSAEYRVLEERFRDEQPWPEPAEPALQFSVENVRELGSMTHYDGTMLVRLGADALQVEPGPKAIGMDVLTIPASAIHSCAMRCFGPRAKHTLLLLPDLGLELGLLNQPELIEWCWQQRLPMASGASHSGWRYRGEALPAHDTYEAQFSSQQTYEAASERSCQGY